MSKESQPAEGSHRFASVGDLVAIDPTVRVIGAERVSIGSNVRIDAFSVLSAGEGGIVIGDYVHIGAHGFLAGSARIELESFIGISGRVSIYSSTDTYSGEGIVGPTIPPDMREVYDAPVKVKNLSAIGAGSVLLPGVTLAEGAGVAALSLVRDDVEPFEMVGGIPAKPIGTRSRTMLEHARRLREATGE
jgi:acetyltransferase-like isoleucine patch superfamily enzyme